MVGETIGQHVQIVMEPISGRDCVGGQGNLGSRLVCAVDCRVIARHTNQVPGTLYCWLPVVGGLDVNA
jgi:hypothetical protein